METGESKTNADQVEKLAAVEDERVLILDLSTVDADRIQNIVENKFSSTIADVVNNKDDYKNQIAKNRYEVVIL
ncbi:MAG: hypothetical protein KDD56_06240, partial [Bdellovibrionales bacterium]|nr:hypothetical protein [Bdellovibrionales bacterium]